MINQMSRGDWICPNCNTKDFSLLVEVNYCKECKQNGLEIEMKQDGWNWWESKDFQE